MRTLVGFLGVVFSVGMAALWVQAVPAVSVGYILGFSSAVGCYLMMEGS